MISSLHGTVSAVGLDHVVIEVGGVGFAVRATPNTLGTLRRGESARLATTLVVREDSLTLFGFGSDAGRELFELVQSVSGVGPKIALALLAVLDPDELRSALATGDTAALTRAPGIGKKGAERLVLELRDKVGVAPTVLSPSLTPSAVAPAPAAPVDGAGQVVEALVGLGFTARQAEDAVGAVLAEAATDPTATGGALPTDVSAVLRRSLTRLGRGR